MTRFDAATPEERRRLFDDAVAAHRERASPYLTLEVDEAVLEREGTPDPDLGVPWVQFADGVVSLDCTDDELQELKALLAEFPAFTIDELTRPDEAEGTHVRVSASADRNRISQFLEAVFRSVFRLPEDGRVWVAEV
ncbi:hypothetical protein ACFQGT_12285 [Natrialbaceae archaeon GCM10025810]|uniref:hypothetical protein n=1 Tax=Halovalidus salilacus TaxID=3075124 RepID=UPI00361A0A9A